MYPTLPLLWRTLFGVATIRYAMSNHTVCDAALTTLFAELLLRGIFFRDYACPEGCRWGS
jgi:hypothetical protein